MKAVQLAWCERCQHTHRVDGPCVTECVDCESDLVVDVETFLATRNQP